MKRIYFSCLWVAIITLVTSCNSNTEQQEETEETSQKYSLILYGSNGCPHCSYFKMRLDSAHVDYVFKDVEQDKLLVDEMLAAVNSINFRGVIAYPVVALDSIVMVNPPPDSLLSLLGK